MRLILVALVVLVLLGGTSMLAAMRADVLPVVTLAAPLSVVLR